LAGYPGAIDKDYSHQRYPGVVCRLLWNTLSGTKYFKMFIILSVSIPGFIIAGWFSGIKHIHYLKEKIFPSNGYC